MVGIHLRVSFRMLQRGDRSLL